MEIREGRITGIVGESGSGKTTLAQAIVNFVNPPMVVLSGDIIIDGKYNILKMGTEEVNQIRGKLIAYVPQAAQNSLNPIRKVKESIADILKGHGIDYNSYLPEIYRTLEEVGLGQDKQVLDMYPFQLSGGMRQRVIIAIALLMDPKIVIMDEPTTGLDVVVQHEILKLIKRLKEEKGLTVVFITHDMAMLFQIADDIVVLYGGQILEIGNYKTLLEDAHHPYTYLLLKSIPTIRNIKGKLARIPGDFGGFINYPRGCVFASRCPFSKEICKLKPPEMKEDNGDKYRCYRYPEWKKEAEVIG